MIQSSAHVPPELRDLLVDRALQGLDEQQEARLQVLLREHPNVDEQLFDRTVGLLETHYAFGKAEHIPPSLHERLRQAGQQWSDTYSKLNGDGLKFRTHQTSLQPTTNSRATRRRRSMLIGLGAIAACFALGVVLWQVPPTTETTPTQLRQSLFVEARDLIVARWSQSQDPVAIGAIGDIAWSGERQEGYIRIRGLAANDPSKAQYQLWIVDASHPDEPPVCGGVFDMPSTSADVIIPILPAVRVCDARQFLVTIEPPGGVLVSAQERVPLHAEVTRWPCR